MATPIFENKVKTWENNRLEIRKSISNDQYGEQNGYFTELEEMAFSSSFKKKEMEERIMQLRSFALGMASIEPDLSAALTSFLTLSETLFGNPDFKSVAMKLKLATDLIENAGKEKAEREKREKERRRKQFEEELRKQEEEEHRRRLEEERRRKLEDDNKRRFDDELRRLEEELRKKENANSRAKNNKHNIVITLISVVLIIILGYHFWYKDYRIDKATPRTFVYATNLFLRSSKVADVDDNRLGTIPYGSELITYSNENGWAYVKTNGQKGYVSSDYLLESVDFFLLNSVWGNEEAKELVPTAKYRLALLDYYKRAGLKGGTEWQLYTKSPGSKEDNVFYSRLFNKNSRFVDFAFLLKNNQTGERRFVLYSFDNETEQPIFCHAMEAPKDAFINDIICNKRSSNIRMTVYYSNGDKTTVNVENAPVVQSRTTERPVSTSNTQSVSQNQTGGVKTAQELNELGLQAYTRRQYEAALNYYNEAAKKGSDEALANLGWMTYKGLGTPKDGAIAISYLKDAVEMGNANACYYLGVLYENGIYDSQLFKDREESLRYYKLGAL